MIATDVKSLSVLSDAIHDRWFDLEQVSHRNNIVEIPLFVPDFKSARGMKRFGPVGQIDRIAMGVIRFDSVEELSIKDTERVGLYDINRLIYEPASRVVEVVTNIPLRFRLQLGALCVSLANSD